MLIVLADPCSPWEADQFMCIAIASLEYVKSPSTLKQVVCKFWASVIEYSDAYSAYVSLSEQFNLSNPSAPSLKSCTYIDDRDSGRAASCSQPTCLASIWAHSPSVRFQKSAEKFVEETAYSRIGSTDQVRNSTYNDRPTDRANVELHVRVKRACACGRTLKKG